MIDNTEKQSILNSLNPRITAQMNPSAYRADFDIYCKQQVKYISQLW